MNAHRLAVTMLATLLAVLTLASSASAERTLKASSFLTPPVKKVDEQRLRHH
jgi:hypothetical protein